MEIIDYCSVENAGTHIYQSFSMAIFVIFYEFIIEKKKKSDSLNPFGLDC